MTDAPTRFVDWLAADLARRGSRFAFGVPGGGTTLDLLLALQEAGLRSVVTAREDAAVIMAGVAGRLAEAPGIAFTTKGPGLASAANGLASALLDRMPVLAVTENFDRDELTFLTHQVFDQARFAAGLFDHTPGTAAPIVAAAAEEVAAALDGMMRSPMGPALLLGDPDRMTAPVAATDTQARTDSASDEAALDRAAMLLADARRPVVVAGLEATTPATAAGIRRLAEALGAPVLVTYMAKGVVPDDHPLFAGIFTGGAIEQACVASADLIILAGLDPVELIRKPWPYSAPVLDISAWSYTPHYVDPAVRVPGPVSTSTLALAAVAGRTDWDEVEIGRHLNRFRTEMSMARVGSLSATGVVEAAAAAFAERPRLTVDAGAHMFSACAFWPCAEPLDLLISNGLASMGFALPAAIAAALHDPARGALAMTGDGGLLMCLGELKTAAALGANVTVIVFNDAALSLIDIKRQQRQMPDLGLSWTAPDFAAIARGFGFEAWTAMNDAEMRGACHAAARSNGPRLIDARVDPAGYPAQLRSLRG
ncbi:MAG: thiamine pyrophosphate-dependent enzyme [Thalassobaculaceae bacterium]|nr:thiamine pyrophosphate-dependent enzyme [Thalassobaculaceae bacterium]